VQFTVFIIYCHMTFVIAFCGEYIVGFSLCVNLHKDADTLTQLHWKTIISRELFNVFLIVET
jgi:hypothetical protein